MFAANGRPLRNPLTPRENQVLCCLAHGRLDKEVATDLGITLGTIRVHRRRIEAKLGTKGLIQSLLVAWVRDEIDLRAIACEVTRNLNVRTDRGNEDLVKEISLPSTI